MASLTEIRDAITLLYTLLEPLVIDGEIQTTAVLNGDVTIDLTSTNNLLTTIDGDTSALAALISGGKFLTTETNSGSIKTAVEALATLISGGKIPVSDTATAALAAIISGGKLLTTETSAASIKTAVEALAAIISSGKLLTTETSAADIKSNLDDLKTYLEPAVVTAAGQKTSSGTVTVSGTKIQVTNTSDTGGMSFTVGDITVYLDVNEQSPILCFSAFTEVVFTMSQGQVANYIVWS